ncbi:MAG: DUF1080 domain-containing protein [Acidobacteriota bacterium]
MERRMFNDVMKAGGALVAASIILAGVSAAAGAAAQQPAAAAATINLDDHAGFDAIFDGKTMTGWDGDPAFWKAEGGALVGQSSAENAVKENTFLIWRGGEPADFELTVDFRMSSTNSGIQFRSVHLPPGTASGRGSVAGKWVLKGYQADIDFDNQYTGMIYEERGRAFLARRGQVVYMRPEGGAPVLTGKLEMTPEELKTVIKQNEWNHVHLIARGNTIINMVNGHVTAIVVDDDVKGRALKGLLGFQMHVGPPMKIEFKNIYMKKL